MTRTDENVNVDDVEEMAEYVTEIITAAGNIAIPRKSGNMRRAPVPWWTAECERAGRERLRAERAHKRNDGMGNKINTIERRQYAEEFSIKQRENLGSNLLHQ